jgi:hypothetical protein
VAYINLNFDNVFIKPLLNYQYLISLIITLISTEITRAYKSYLLAKQIRIKYSKMHLYKKIKQEAAMDNV